MDTERMNISQAHDACGRPPRDVQNGAPMPADRLDLAARLAAATRHDTVKGFAINAAFEVARREVDEATATHCDPSGTGRRAGWTAYPVGDALNVLWAAADRLERPLGGVVPALEAVGRQAGRAWLASLRGRAALQLARAPRAVLSQLPVAYAAAVSFGERYLDWTGDGRCRLELDHDFFPLDWHRGLVASFLDAAGAEHAALEGRVPGFMRLALELRWG
jgi:uncharacterized protein (TIGR02265 family)